jgi:hypothetical protein
MTTTTTTTTTTTKQKNLRFDPTCNSMFLLFSEEI